MPMTGRSPARRSRLDTLINRGNALLELKRTDEALESYDRALAREPDNIAALIGRGHALRDLRAQ